MKISRFFLKNCNFFSLNLMFALLEKCAYSELFWCAFSRIRTEYGGIIRITPYSLRMRENIDQNNSESGHVLRSVEYAKCLWLIGSILDHFDPQKNWSVEIKGRYNRFLSLKVNILSIQPVFFLCMLYCKSSNKFH